jgi:hypothetical protein
MTRLSKQEIQSASLDVQRSHLKLWQPRNVIMLRSYSSFKEIRRKALAISVIYVAPILGIFIFTWLDRQH